MSTNFPFQLYKISYTQHACPMRKSKDYTMTCLCKAQRQGTLLAPPISNRSARKGVVWPAPLCSDSVSTGKDVVPIVLEAGWASEPVWTTRKISSQPGLDPYPLRIIRLIIMCLPDFTQNAHKYFSILWQQLYNRSSLPLNPPFFVS
jgi:hypothetical protein